MGLIAAGLCVPFFRTVFGMGDEGVLLNGAERMLRGSTLYADFFEFLPPGGFVLTEAWFSIAGISVGSARSLAILTIVGIACFTYLACRQASKNAPLSALLATGWVVMSQGVWTQVSHHWFTTLFSMVAAWAALANVEHAQRWLRWPLIAGAAAGMAAMVTPHRGALAMLAAVTAFLNLRRHRAELIAYVLGCALVPAGLLAYVVGHHALAAAFDDVIRFTAGRYAAIQSVPFGFGGEKFPLTYLFPLAALLTLLVCAPDWRSCLRDRLLWSCAAFGLAGFLGCFPRPDISSYRLCGAFGLPLACMLHDPAYPTVASCVVAVSLLGCRGCRCRDRALCSFCRLFLADIPGSAACGDRADAAGRRGVLRAAWGPELLARIAATPSGDAYFFYPYMLMLPFLTAREQVSKYDIFTPGYTLPSQYQDACISVMRHASWVVIDRRGTDPNVLKQRFLRCGTLSRKRLNGSSKPWMAASSWSHRRGLRVASPPGRHQRHRLCRHSGVACLLAAKQKTAKAGRGRLRVARDGGANRVGSTARGDTIDNGLHMASAKEIHTSGPWLCFCSLSLRFIQIHFPCCMFVRLLQRNGL